MFDVILACGSREAAEKQWGEVVALTIARNMFFGGILIHGDARGIDRMSEEVTDGLDRTVERYPAIWDEHGKSAGPIRNSQMLKRVLELQAEGLAVAVFAFHDDIGSSKGTQHMGNITRKSGVPLHVISSKGKVKKYERSDPDKEL